LGNLKSVIILPAILSSLLSACGSAPPRTSARLELYPLITQTGPRLQSPANAAEFSEFFSRATEGPLVPGLLEGAVPQGLAYAREGNLLLVSAYFDGSTPSALMAVDRESGKLAKTIWLATDEGIPLHGHVGGVASGPKTIWIASDLGVYRYALSDYASAQSGTLLSAKAFFPTAVVASSATYADGVMWIGEFAYYGPGGGRYQTDTSHHLSAPDGELHHALMAGYAVDQQTGELELSKPEYLLSIPDRVQGMAFVDSGVYLSISYGRRNDSILEEHRNPLDEPPAGRLGSGALAGTPYWFLDSTNRTISLPAPPMMEGLAVSGRRLLLLFESGAERYRYTGRASVDRLYSIAVE